MLFVLGLTQSVHVKICVGMHRGSDFKFPEYIYSDCNKIWGRNQTQISTRLVPQVTKAE